MRSTITCRTRSGCTPRCCRSRWPSLAVVLGCITGSAAAIALHDRRFPGKGLLTGIILAPIVVPLIVLALGEYLSLFAWLHVMGSWVAIARGACHAGDAIRVHFGADRLTAELNPALIRSARSLGAGGWRCSATCIGRRSGRAYSAAAILGFAVSFDEVVIALFLQGPNTVTLPVRMFTAIQFELTPKVAASASLFILLATLALIAQSLLPARRPALMMDAASPAALVGDVTQPAGRHVDVQHIWKAYTPGNFVVRDVTFTLQPGEFLTLLGPSGSGKTSTLMMVAGFETPSEGEIRVDGKDVANLPPERRNFGVVFQGYALFPHMSVLDNVEFPLRMKRVARAAAAQAGHRDAGARRPGRLRRAPPARVVGRPAATRRAGPRAGVRAGCAVAGRTARRVGSQAARAVAA